MNSAGILKKCGCARVLHSNYIYIRFLPFVVNFFMQPARKSTLINKEKKNAKDGVFYLCLSPLFIRISLRFGIAFSVNFYLKLVRIILKKQSAFGFGCRRRVIKGYAAFFQTFAAVFQFAFDVYAGSCLFSVIYQIKYDDITRIYRFNSFDFRCKIRRRIFRSEGFIHHKTDCPDNQN